MTNWMPCLLALAATPVPSIEGGQLERFSPSDVFQLEYASDPRISPDGSLVVYERRSFDALSDRARSSLWIVRADGGEHRSLSQGEANEGSPRWSPDGRRLAFLSSSKGSTQVHVRWLDSGANSRLTSLTDSPGSPGAPVWSPDGRWLALTLWVEEPSEPFAKLPEKPEGAQWAPIPKLITALHYRQDGEGSLKVGHRQLFVLPTDGGTPRQLTRGAFDVDGEPCWTADGREIVFSSNRRPDGELDPLDSELWACRAEDGELRQLTDRRGPDTGPVVSPDGALVAYTGFDDRYQGYQVTRLFVAPLAGGAARALSSELDCDVFAPAWSADSKSLLFAFDERGDTKIGRVSLAGERAVLAAGLGGESLGRPYSSGSFSLARNGAFAFTHTTPGRPSDVHLSKGPSGAVALTQLNEDLLGARELGAIEELTCPSSFDQRPIHGWVVHPPGFDPEQNYPLILEIHGGPFANYGGRFSAEMQLYAAAGYVVLYLNPRGSTSYGEEFGNLIHHAYPGQDYDDLISGVDALLARGYVDPQRLYVTGGSGGGVLTAWIVGKTDRFRAAVAAKPVINWASFALTADEYPFFARYWFSAPPWEDPAQYFARSPLSLVGNVKTPTMVLTGEADYRTPISESEQYYQALKLRKVDAALVRIPEASHAIDDRPSRLIAKVAYILEWFERHGGSSEEAR